MHKLLQGRLLGVAGTLAESDAKAERLKSFLVEGDDRCGDRMSKSPKGMPSFCGVGPTQVGKTWEGDAVGDWSITLFSSIREC